MRLTLGLVFVALLLTSGCLAVSPDAIIKSSPVVQNFLKDYPNAQITATFYTADEFSQISSQIEDECEKNVTPKDYYKVMITDEDSGLSITAWVDWNKQLIECAVKKGTAGEKIESYDKEELEGKDMKKNYHICTEDEKMDDVCTMDYKPVCGYGKDGIWKTYSNACTACSSRQVYKWKEGKCDDSQVSSSIKCEEHHKVQCHDGNLYWYDSCGNVEEKKTYCENGCEDGACIENPAEETCAESDNGYDIYQKGVAEAGTQRLEDHCNEDGRLTEKYCENGEIKAKTTECPEGYVCKDAACVNASGTDEELCEEHADTICNDGHVYWMDSCGNIEDKKEYCENGCEDGACVNETQNSSVELALTPAYQGWSIKSVEDGNDACESQYGEGWKWFEFHDDPQYGQWETTGVLVHGNEFLEGKSHLYAWIWIYDQRAECFSLGNDYGLTFRITPTGEDSRVNANCFNYDEYNGSSYYNPYYYEGHVKCNPYEGDTPCNETRSLLCIKKDLPVRISSCNPMNYGAYCTIFTSDPKIEYFNVTFNLVGVNSEASAATLSINGELDNYETGESVIYPSTIKTTIDSINLYPSENVGSIGLKIELLP